MGARDPGLDRADDRELSRVIAAAYARVDAAPHHSVAIQLFAQEAKAWARYRPSRKTSAHR